MLKELYRYRQVLYMIAWRDIRIKYKQSIMGVMWALFMPTLIVIAGVLVKTAMAALQEIPLEYSEIVTVAVKSLPWAFFVAAVKASSMSLIGNNNLVTKIYFPKEIFPFSSVLSQSFDFLIASVSLVVILTITTLLGITDIKLSIYLLWVPVLIALLVLFCGALGLFLSAANLFFRDVKYIVEVILTFGIFFTPVFFEVSKYSDKHPIVKLAMYNPVAPVLEGLASCVVSQTNPDPFWLWYCVIISFVGFLLAYLMFKKLEPAFAESI